MSPSPNARRSPYKGLIPYAEGDAPFFFGREKETRLIIANMFASPLTLLYGPSGVGKSSVLRAGVAHQLHQRDDLIVVPFSTWQGNSVGDLVQTIVDYARRADRAKSSEVPNHLNSTLPPLVQPSLPEYLQACYQQTGRRLMIILDQFEEYFLYHPQGDTFADEFPQAVLQADVPVSFLISIREDSLARLDCFEGRIPNLFDNYLRVEHLNYDAARTAIENPVEQYNKQLIAGEHPVSIEPALVDRVLEQVQTGQVILAEAGRGILKSETAAGQVETPFLQMVMTRLWDEEMRAGSHVLRLASLDGLGGAERIVRTHLDETMGALSPERQCIAAEAFHYLVTPSGTKIAHTIPDLAEYVGRRRKDLAPALEQLASGDTRILRGIEPPPDQPGEPRYEIFHDVLAAAILDWRARYIQAREIAGQQLKLAAERKRSKRLRLALLGVAALLLVVTGLAVSYYTRHHPIDSIAVLPFNTDGSAPGLDQLGDEMGERIIHNLSQVPGIRVVPFKSTQQYKGQNVDPQAIGRDLDVRAILVGRIFQRDNSIILSAELIATRDKRQLWGLENPVKFSDLLLMPNEIVAGVSDAIGIQLNVEEEKKKGAETFYIKGRNSWNRRTTDGLNDAMANFNQALQLDPNYALAYGGLADCYNMLVSYGAKPPKEAFPKAHDAAIKALAIDNELAEAHAALAYTTFRGDWNWSEAEKEFRRAISLNDDYALAHQWYANYLAGQGRFSEAIKESRRAEEIEKSSLIINAQVGLINYLAQRFDESIRDCKKTIELDPSFFLARRYLGLSYAQKGMYKEAIAEFEKVIASSGSSLILRAEYANTLALSGDTTRARTELANLIELSNKKYISAYHIAAIYVCLKDKDRALEWLERAFQERADWMVFIKVDPRFDSLHSDPRFKELLRRMKLS